MLDAFKAGERFSGIAIRGTLAEEGRGSRSGHTILNVTSIEGLPTPATGASAVDELFGLGRSAGW